MRFKVVSFLLAVGLAVAPVVPATASNSSTQANVIKPALLGSGSVLLAQDSYNVYFFFGLVTFRGPQGWFAQSDKVTSSEQTTPSGTFVEYKTLGTYSGQSDVTADIYYNLDGNTVCMFVQNSSQIFFVSNCGPFNGHVRVFN